MAVCGYVYAFTRCKTWLDTEKGVCADLMWLNVNGNHTFKALIDPGDMGVSFVKVWDCYVLML